MAGRRDRVRETGARYDALSRYYDTFLEPFHERLRRRGIALLDVSSDERVLDIGCGTGRGTAELGATIGSGGAVVGIDIAEEMCLSARERLGDRDSSLVVRGDALRLPFHPGSFDAALVSFTLELFDERHRNRLLNEIQRVLAPGGRICVIAPSTARGGPIASLYQRLNDVIPRLIDSRPLDVTGTLSRTGFKVIRVRHDHVLIVPVEIVLARR